MKAYTITEDRLNEIHEDAANRGIGLILGKLHRDNVISKKQYDEYLRDYYVIVKKPSFFTSLVRKVFKKDELNSDRYWLVKLDGNYTGEENDTDDKPDNGA